MNDRSNYIEVSERLRTFIEKYPSGSLQSEYTWDERDGERCLVVKAYAFRDPEDTKPGVGHAWEPVPGRTPYTRGSELMVGETSAWGRALAALGIAVHHGIASANEIRAAGDRTANVIERSKPQAVDDDEWNRPAGSDLARRASAKQKNYIVGLARKMNHNEPGDILALVNSALRLAHLPELASATSMNDAQARAVIERLKAATEDQEAARALGVEFTKG